MTSTRAAFVASVCISLGGCASVGMTQSGALSSYSNLPPAAQSNAKAYVDKRAIASARTVSIVPTRMLSSAQMNVPRISDRGLVANAVDRSMCMMLAETFVVVRPGQAADLTVHATVSEILPTGKAAAGISKVATLGTSAVLPVGIPRLPIGLGGLAVEIEALDASGVQRAAMTWAKGANSITSSARVSEIGDAYGLAGAAGKRFGRMLVEANANPGLKLPSVEGVATSLGARSRSSVCDDFGRSPGLSGFAGGLIGAPPSWTDFGPAD